MSVENLRAVWNKADQIDRNSGVTAYFAYHRSLKRLAHQTDLPLESVVGVFAALSPNSDYLGNLRGAITMCRAFRSGKSLSSVTVATYGHCSRMAWQVLKGAKFLDITAGKKIRSFYQNILEPDNPEPVTIDGHIFAASLSSEYQVVKASRPSSKQYDKTVTEVKELAGEYGLVPNQMQATLWFTWKRLHAPVKGDGQLVLSGDHWNLFPDIEDLRPFREKPRPEQPYLFHSVVQPMLWK